MAFEKAKNVEDLFKELDDQDFSDIAKPLASYRRALMKEGFTRREAFKFVEAYSKFIYDVSLEDFMHDKRKAEIAQMNEELDEEFSRHDEDEDDDYED